MRMLNNKPTTAVESGAQAKSVGDLIADRLRDTPMNRLADLAGVSTGAMSHYYRDRIRFPRQSTIDGLSRALGVSKRAIKEAVKVSQTRDKTFKQNARTLQNK